MKSPALPTDWDFERQRRLVSRMLAQCRDSPDLALWALGSRIIDGRPFSFENHEYLHGPYSDQAASITIRKGAQLGATELAISKALYVATTIGGRTIYYLPTEAAGRQLSRDRFDPAIKQSPFLRAQIGPSITPDSGAWGRGAFTFGARTAAPR